MGQKGDETHSGTSKVPSAWHSAKLFYSTNSLLSEESPERNSSLEPDKHLATSDSFLDGITTAKI